MTSPPPGASPLAQSHPRLTLPPAVPAAPIAVAAPVAVRRARRAPVAGRARPSQGAEENVGETLRHNFLPSLGGLDQL